MQADKHGVSGIFRLDSARGPLSRNERSPKVPHCSPWVGNQSWRAAASHVQTEQQKEKQTDRVILTLETASTESMSASRTHSLRGVRTPLVEVLHEHNYPVKPSN